MFLICTLLTCLFSLGAEAAGDETVYGGEERSVLLNDGWKYLGWDQGPEDIVPDFGADVTIPHDWMIAREFSEEGEAESAFLKGGAVWYARELILAEDCADRLVFLDFDGVCHNASVYVNGMFAAERPYGYVPFSVDITDLVTADGETKNIIAVRLDTSGPASRWYSGGGILRDVSLRITGPVSFAKDGFAVMYDETVKKDGDSCLTTVSAEVINRTGETRRLAVRAEITDETGKKTASVLSEQAEVPAGGEAVISCRLEAEDIRLWKLSRPSLYRASLSLVGEDEVLDEVSVTYGYRWTDLDPDHGFFLNGEAMKLKGVCLHQDLGAFGAVDSSSLWSQRLMTLKQMGCNAVRIAHDPASARFLSLCAEMGILVIEEAFDTWTYAKNWNMNDRSSCFSQETGQTRLAGVSPEMCWAEADLKAMIRRDRNNPAVIMWSLGNEILGNIGVFPEEYPDIAEALAVWANEADGARPVTIGDNRTDGKVEIQNRMDANIVAQGGVIGLNYASAREYDALHKKHPDYAFYGSETASELSSRSWYAKMGTDEDALQVSSWDREAVEWGNTARQAWLDVVSRDFIAGEFVWTGYDYLGEPEPWNGVQAGSVSGRGPIPRSSYFGILDTAGLPKDSYYFYQSQWRDDITVLHILPDWQEGLSGKVEVTVYTNAPEAELFLNGRSLGKKKAQLHTSSDGYAWQTYDGDLAAVWSVEYEPGILEAAAYDENGGKISLTAGRSAAAGAEEGKALVFDVKRLRFREGDIIRIPVRAADENGVTVSGAGDKVSFSCEGCRLLLADNGDAADITPYIFSGTEAERSLFGGYAAVFAVPEEDAEKVVIRAEAEGLEPAEITVPKDVPLRHVTGQK